MKMKKKYVAPKINVIVLEPQQILVGSPDKPAQKAPGHFTYDNEIQSGDNEDVWESK